VTRRTLLKLRKLINQGPCLDCDCPKGQAVKEALRIIDANLEQKR